MTPNVKQLKEFQKIYEKVYNQKINNDQAKLLASCLLDLIDILSNEDNEIRHTKRIWQEENLKTLPD